MMKTIIIIIIITNTFHLQSTRVEYQMNESNRLKKRPLECDGNQNHYAAIIVIIFPGFINNKETICCARFVNTAERNAAAASSVVLVSVEQNANTFPSAFRPHSRSVRGVHETRLLVLSGFTLTVIHMNVSSRNPQKHRKRLRSRIGAVAASVLCASTCKFKFFVRYFPRRKLDAPRHQNHIANKPFHIENYVIKIETQRSLLPCNLCVDEIQRGNQASETKDNVSHRLISRVVPLHIELITQRSSIDMLELLIIGNKKA